MFKTIKLYDNQWISQPFETLWWPTAEVASRAFRAQDLLLNSCANSRSISKQASLEGQLHGMFVTAGLLLERQYRPDQQVALLKLALLYQLAIKPESKSEIPGLVTQIELSTLSGFFMAAAGLVAMPWRHPHRKVLPLVSSGALGAAPGPAELASARAGLTLLELVVELDSVVAQIMKQQTVVIVKYACSENEGQRLISLHRASPLKAAEDPPVFRLNSAWAAPIN